MSKRVHGAMLSYAQISVKIVAALFSTPIIVSALGQENYGLFSLAGAMAGYLYLLDFGLNDAVLRFFVSHEREPEERNAFLNRMMGFYSLIGLAVLVAAAILAAAAGVFFAHSLRPEQISVLRELILVIGVGAALLVAFNPVSALLSATENFTFLRLLDIAVTILSTLLIVVLLKLGFGVLTVVVVMAGSMVSQVVVRSLYVATSLKVRLRISRPQRADLSNVGGYAAPIFLSMIAEMIFWKMDQLIIGIMLGAAPVAIYSIGLMFKQYFMSFGTAISRVMTPQVVRRMDEGADARALMTVMVRISRIQSLILLLVLGELIVFGQHFLILWLGHEYSLSYYVMLAVLIPYTIELIGNSRNIVLQVKRLYWQKSAIILSMALLNIPLTIYLITLLGVVGAAVSTGIAIILGYAMIAVLLQRRAGLPMLTYFLQTARGIAPVFVVVVGSGVVLQRWMPENWFGLIAGATVFALIYAQSMFVFATNPDERKLIRKVWTSVFRVGSWAT